MDNRSNILKCAAELFYQKGYDAVGVQEIVDCAGTTKPTLYYYFKSKYGLLESVLESFYEPFLARIEQVSEFQGDLEETLQNTCKEYLRIVMDNRKVYMFALSLVYSARENEAYKAARPYMVRAHDIIVKIFEKVSCNLESMSGRQQQFASGFEGVINFYLIYYFEKNEPEIDIDEISASIVKQFMYGIYS